MVEALKPPLAKIKMAFAATTFMCVCVVCVHVCVCAYRWVYVGLLLLKEDTYSEDRGGVVFHKFLSFLSETIKTLFFTENSLLFYLTDHPLQYLL